ncbi:MAG: hypothetical protein V4632_06810 [Pseudomonadota bacterium]
MKLPLIVVSAFLSGCLLTALVNPVQTAIAQDRSRIQITPKSTFEHVLAGENIWMFDSSANQMIGCHFAGPANSRLLCERTKLP